MFNNKRMISAMAILMVLSFAISMFATADFANAQTVDTKRPSYPFVFTNPTSHAGVGQPIKVNFGLTNNLATATDGWNVTLKVTDPDGKVEEIKRTTWSTGYTLYNYIPSKEGNYTFQCLFNETVYNPTTAALRGKYQTAESDEVIILVGEWKMPYPGHALPTEYWTRPIDGQLWEWKVISGSWVFKDYNREAFYNEAPLSAHVLWETAIGDTLGGLTGGADYNTDNYSVQSGDAYEGRYGSPTIIAGVLYYDKYQSGNPVQSTVAIDVRTGKTLWDKTLYCPNNAGVEVPGRIITGQILRWDSINSHGTWHYLWVGSSTSESATTMRAFDAATGNVVYTLTNIPAGHGRLYYGENGEILKYQIVNINGVQYFQQWNSSRIPLPTESEFDPSWGSAVRGQTINCSSMTTPVDTRGVVIQPPYAVRMIDINVSLPSDMFAPQPVSAGVANLNYPIIYVFPGDKAIFGTRANYAGYGNITLSAISLNPEEGLGTVLYKNRVWNAPDSFSDILGESYAQSDWGAVSAEEQVIVYYSKYTRQHYAFSTETGRYLWQTKQQVAADSWMAATLLRTPGCYNFAIIAYGKLISASVGGVVYCYDLKTGETLWEYAAEDKYTESYLSGNWWLTPVIASTSDPKDPENAIRMVYFGVEEHSVQEPKPRGAPFFALDVDNDGAVVWEITGMFRQSQWGGQAIMGDSVIVTPDTYNQMLYGIGKGPSETTVTAPNVAVTAGTTALITGTVMDVSPGTQTDKMALRFPNGVAAVSEASMNPYMKYVYKVMDPLSDEKIEGVDVTVYAVQGDTYEEIGTTTSSSNGKFSIAWTPKEGATGEWDIYAYFNGSNSYYGSYAQSSMYVSAAPVVVEPETIPYEWYIVGMGIAIIAVVIIFGLLSLRKK